MKSIIILLLLSLVTSCSSYINQMHKEFDRADGKPPVRRKSDQFSKYRRQKVQQSYGQTATTTASNPYVVPAVKRDYRPVSSRVKANDLEDNRGDGSLWSGVGERNNFLFTLNKEKKNGDIVLIKVEAKLRNDITNELKRAFPRTVKKVAATTGTEEKQEGATEDQVSTAQAAPATDENVEDKTYDRISSVVVEEISRDHILLRGRKNVLFHERKRTVEVQALVSRKDIGLDDAILSDKILESNVTVLR